MFTKKEDSGEYLVKILLRRVLHQTDTEKKKAERYITNSIFVNEAGKRICLYPISEFMDNKCKVCGNDGCGMDDNMEVYCGKCLCKLFGKSELVKEKALMVPSVEQAVRGNAFEWQPQGKDNWYKVRGTNLIPDTLIRLSKKEVMERWTEIMSKVLEDDPQLVEGEYDKENKLLVIYV